MPINKNEPEAANRRLLIPFYDNAGALLAGQTFSHAAHEVQISQNGSAWADTTADAVAIGGGFYYVELTQAEVNFTGAFVAVKLTKATYKDVISFQDMMGSTSLETIAAVLKINGVLDKTVYNANGLLTSGRWRIFASKAAADSATDGAADNAEGEIYRFLVVSTDEGDGKLKTYELARAL